MNLKKQVSAGKPWKLCCKPKLTKLNKIENFWLSPGFFCTMESYLLIYLWHTTFFLKEFEATALFIEHKQIRGS